MEADFWHDMWATGEVGFHQKQVNQFLESHWPEVDVAPDAKVLVPLCGKSLDMLWLKEKGHEVIGVELSQKALDEFLEEHSLVPKMVRHESYCGYQLEDMTLFCGDFFHLNEQDCKGVSAVYDRAALIALPPEMRSKYVKHIRNLLPDNSRILLVTMEYDQSLMPGPPFAVMEDEVKLLYRDANIECVNQMNFERKGHLVAEKVYQIIL
jgi:thiopurine S-methyltransferase